MARSYLLINFVFILLIILVSTWSSIANAKEPLIFIKEVTTEASNILKKNISKEEKIMELRELAENNVDIKGVGFYSLGKHRKTVSQDQLKEYEKLFKEYFLKSFSSRLSEYTDPKINVLSEEVINTKYTIVFSVLEADEKRPEIKIDWRVYTLNPEKPLVRDLIIEGLSLARTQREEFNSIIQNADGNIEVLFSSLKKFIND